MNISKAKNDQDTNNGRSIIKTGINFQKLDTSKDVESDFEILKNLYNNIFDDGIYWPNGTAWGSRADAENWAQRCILSIVDPEAPYAPSGPRLSGEPKNL